jgi:hypothetical protein
MGNGTRHYWGMPRQQLRDALQALHTELESGGAIAADDREALLQAVNEIQEALSRSGGEPPEEGSLSQRVSALIEDLETSHPRFAETLRSLSEALSNLGI